MKHLFATFLGSVWLVTSALAQGFDLTTLPDGYSFISHGSDGVTTVTFLRPDGETFLFEQSITYLDGDIWMTTLRVNQQSQTVSSTSPERIVRFSPHDCAPSLGECSYRAEQDGFLVKYKRDTKMLGDVFVIDDYRLEDGTWVNEQRSCATFDQYGFWIDYYMVYPDDTERWGMRDTPTYAQDFEARLARLKNICVPLDVVS